jgi:hypothetical protein
VIDITVTNTKKATTDLSKELDQIVRSVSLAIFNQVKDLTPVAKTSKGHVGGRAKRNWKLRGSNKSYTVSNDVPYIERLDKGYSKQAPEGMTRPALREVINRQRRVTR